MFGFVLSLVLVLAVTVFQQDDAADCSLLSASDVSSVLGESMVAKNTFGCEYDSQPGTTPFKVIRFIPSYPSTRPDFQSESRRAAQDNDGLATFTPLGGVGDEAYTWHDGLGYTRVDVRSGSHSVEIFVDLGVFGTQDVAARTAIGTQLASLAVDHFNNAAGSPAMQPSTDAAPPVAGGADGGVSEDLVFTGALSGHMTAGRRGNTYVCAGGNFAPPSAATQTNNSALAIGPIVGDVGGTEVQMNVTRLNYAGPGSYDAAGVGFDAGADHYYQVRGQAGSFTVNSDGRGGTVEMDLAVNSDPTTAVGHVQGAWQCPADAY
jgi:hypothetical protein